MQIGPGAASNWIGIAMAREFADAHDGKIWVKAKRVKADALL